MSTKFAFNWLAALFLAAAVGSAAIPAPAPVAAQQEPADKECPVRCVREFNRVFEECIAGSGDPLACATKAQEALAKCLRECRPKPTPKPGASGCEDKCREKSNAVLKQCLEKQPDRPAECEAMAKEAFTNCMKECTPATRQPSCRGTCEQKRVEAIKACVANGGTEEQCKKDAEPAYQACLQACPTEVPKPTALSCEGKCSQRSEEAYKKCKNDGGTEEECRLKAKLALDECVKNECKPRATSVPSCGSLCEREAEANYKICIVTKTEAECRAAMETELRECRAKCPTATPKPTDKPRPTELSCAARCEAKAKEVYEKCKKDNGSEEDCAARQKATYAECVQGCDKPRATPVPSCGSLCEREAEANYKICIVTKTEAECRAAMETELRECRAKCPTATPKPTDKPRPTELSCAARCEAKAKEVYEKCKKDNGSEEDCAARQKATYAECVQGCDKPRATPVPSCGSLCEREAEANYKICIVTKTEAECRAAMETELRECRAKCPTATPKPTEKPNCQDDCQAKAKAVYTTCRMNGVHTAEECWTLAVTALRECIKVCFANTEASCTALCAKLREPVVKLCKSVDGIEGCEDRAAKVVSDCANACVRPNPMGWSFGN